MDGTDAVDKLRRSLEQAWSVVKDLDLPDAAVGEALRIAFERLESPAARPPAPKRSVPNSRMSEESSSAAPDEFDADQFFAEFSRESGLAEDQLRRLYAVAGDSAQVATTRSSLGTTEAAKNRAIAALVLGARYFTEGKREVGIAEVRAVAKALHHKPSRNLTTHLDHVPGTYAVNSGDNKSVRVKEAAFPEAFANLVAQILGAEQA